MSQTLPLSVIVSTCDSGATLRQALVAIRLSELAFGSYEIIVVDDVSTDGSVAIAARHADTVVRLNGRRSGPAYARNRGAELARGEVVAFVDPDVVIRPNTLPEMLATLAERRDIDAISASHDEEPTARNFVSRYWNLLLCYGEMRSAGRSGQFALGCGAVRRKAFVAAGMYDEWRFAKASLEDLELGERMLGAGHALLLSSQLKVARLRRWDLRSICKEVWHRSRLVSRSLGYIRLNAAAPGEVVFTLSRTLIPATGLLGILLLAAAFAPSPETLSRSGLAGVLALILTNLPFYAYCARARGIGFAMVSVPLHVLVQGVAGVALCNGWILRDIVGDVSPDATTQAYSEVGLEIWPPVPRKL